MPWQTGSMRYTAYIYMADDIQVPWRATVAWARATPALAAFNVTYGFYRTEVSPKTGELVLVEITVRLNVTQLRTL